MSTSIAFLEILTVISMAIAAAAIAVGLSAWWTRDEAPSPTADTHAARNASEAFATLALGSMLGAMLFVLVPILFVLTPFLLLAAWTLIEPPVPGRYA